MRNSRECENPLLLVTDASGKLELRLDLSGFSPLLIVLVLVLDVFYATATPAELPHFADFDLNIQLVFVIR